MLVVAVESEVGNGIIAAKIVGNQQAHHIMMSLLMANRSKQNQLRQGVSLVSENLIEKAKSRRKKIPRFEITREHYDLCVAWCKEDITLTQLAFALNVSETNKRDAMVMVATIFKESYFKGFINFNNPELLKAEV